MSDTAYVVTIHVIAVLFLAGCILASFYACEAGLGGYCG